MRLTRLGKFTWPARRTARSAVLKKLRGNRKPAAGPAAAAQMKMLRQLPQAAALHPRHRAGRARLFPGAAILAGRLGGESRQHGPPAGGSLRRRPQRRPLFAASCKAARAGRISRCRRSTIRASPGRIVERVEQLPAVAASAGTVGLLLLRSYVLAGNAGHYDGVIAALEARGLRVIPAFASGLDQRPAIERFFMRDGDGRGRCGGVADRLLAGRRPRLQRRTRRRGRCWPGSTCRMSSAHPVEFQTLEQWQADPRGLMPVESDHDGGDPRTRRRDRADGVRRPFGARRRRRACGATCAVARPSAAAMLAARVRAECCVAPAAAATRRSNGGIARSCCSTSRPTPGNTGTAAFLSVFASLHRTLRALQRRRLPGRCAGRASMRCGSASSTATPRASAPTPTSHVRIPRRRPRAPRDAWLRADRGAMGPGARPPAERRQLASSCWASGSATCSSASSPPSATRAIRCGCCSSTASRRRTPSRAFYRWLREDFGAHAVLHFGTHGALEFMPGKQAGLSAACWPDRLIGDLPNFYLYASNNPSEGTHRQAPRRCDADQLSDAAGRACRAVSRACST